MRHDRDKVIGQGLMVLAILALAFIATIFDLQIANWPFWARFGLALGYIALAFYVALRVRKWYP